MSNNGRLTDAGKILALAAEYDERFRDLSEQENLTKVQAWAFQIAETDFTESELLEGVRRAYSQPDKPFNPIGAIIFEAKQAYRLSRRGSVLKELAEGAESKAGVHGEPILAAYEHNNAIKLRCFHCGAPAGEFCADDDRDRKIPHAKRLADAYAKTPEGSRLIREREEHLERHRATYKPKWTK